MLSTPEIHQSNSHLPVYSSSTPTPLSPSPPPPTHFTNHYSHTQLPPPNKHTPKPAIRSKKSLLMKETQQCGFESISVLNNISARRKWHKTQGKNVILLIPLPNNISIPGCMGFITNIDEAVCVKCINVNP